MSTGSTYRPRPGTVAARVILWLKQQEPGAEYSSLHIAEELGIDSKGLSASLEAACKYGLVSRRQRYQHPSAPIWWRLTVGPANGHDVPAGALEAPTPARAPWPEVPGRPPRAREAADDDTDTADPADPPVRRPEPPPSWGAIDAVFQAAEAAAPGEAGPAHADPATPAAALPPSALEPDTTPTIGRPTPAEWAAAERVAISCAIYNTGDMVIVLPGAKPGDEPRITHLLPAQTAELLRYLRDRGPAAATS